MPFIGKSHREAIVAETPQFFDQAVLERAKVAVAPGIGFGEYGDGHVRIALVENTHRLRQAVRNIRAFMAPGNAPNQQESVSA